jgi:hypothetical protein
MGPALLEGRTGKLWQPLLLPCTCRSAAFSGRPAAARGTSRCRRRAQRSGAGAASPARCPLACAPCCNCRTGRCSDRGVARLCGCGAGGAAPARQAREPRRSSGRFAYAGARAAIAEAPRHAAPAAAPGDAVGLKDAPLRSLFPAEPAPPAPVRAPHAVAKACGGVGARAGLACWLAAPLRRGARSQAETRS